MKRLFIIMIMLSICGTAEARSYNQRPYRWCGWYMRTQMHRDPGPAFNLARNWAHYGSRAFGPAIGVLVVWRHHVGEIVGRANHGQWMVHSGNDGHAVRTRARSVRGAIAFRWPDNRRYASR